MNTLYIFDIDDTLIDTKACVRLVDRYDNIIARFGTKVYNGAVNTGTLIQPGCKLDYYEFESFERIKTEPIKQAMDVLMSMKNLEDVYIITARRNRKMLYAYFHYLRIDIKESHIHTNNQNGPIDTWKGNTLAKLIDKYDKVEIWEDDWKNIRCMEAVCKANHKQYIIHAV